MGHKASGLRITTPEVIDAISTIINNNGDYTPKAVGVWYTDIKDSITHPHQIIALMGIMSLFVKGTLGWVITGNGISAIPFIC